MALDIVSIYFWAISLSIFHVIPLHGGWSLWQKNYAFLVQSPVFADGMLDYL